MSANHRSQNMHRLARLSLVSAGSWLFRGFFRSTPITIRTNRFALNEYKNLVLFSNACRGRVRSNLEPKRAWLLLTTRLTHAPLFFLCEAKPKLKTLFMRTRVQPLDRTIQGDLI